MSDSNKVDYNKMSDEELSRMELIRKSEERDRIEGYKKTGKKGDHPRFCVTAI